MQEKNPDKDQIISQIPATIFNSDINRIFKKFREANLGNELKDGIEVRVLCKLDLYPPHGHYSIIIKDIDPEFLQAKKVVYCVFFVCIFFPEIIFVVSCLHV